MPTTLFVASVLSVAFMFTEFLSVMRKEKECALALLHTKIREELHIKLTAAFHNNAQFLIILQFFLFIPLFLTLESTVRSLHLMPCVSRVPEKQLHNSTFLCVWK